MPRVRTGILLLASVPVLAGGLVNGCGGHLGRGAAGGEGGAGGEHSNATGEPAGGSGAVAAGGAAGAAAGGASFGEPACAPSVDSGEPCTPTDAQFCYKRCGPDGVGVKSETCQSSGLYTEMVGCAYDLSRDYSCYRIANEPNVGCTGGQRPQAGRPCDLAPCTVCNSLGGLAGGEFASGAGAVSEGWCVCPPANAGGVRTWSCAGDTTWPCPIGIGC